MKTFLTISFLIAALTTVAQPGLRVEYLEGTPGLKEYGLSYPLFGRTADTENTPPPPASLLNVFAAPLVQIQNVPGIYNYQCLPFFCRIEVDMEKRNQMPVKFRLGNVQYVDWLEQKE